MSKRITSLVLGFILAGSGLFALILMMVGVQVNYLVWLDTWGGLIGFILRLVLIMTGAVFIVLSTTNWQRERAEIEEYRQQQLNTPKENSLN